MVGEGWKHAKREGKRGKWPLIPDSMHLTEARRWSIYRQSRGTTKQDSTREGKLKEVKQNDKLEIDAAGDKYAQRRT